MNTVLIVEDEPSIGDMIREILQDEGLSATCVTSGEAALQKARTSNFDIIFLDVCMPGMSGLDVARTLRAETATARTPLVFCTVMDTDESLFDGFDVGGNAYLVKPITRDQVSSVARLITQEHATA